MEKTNIITTVNNVSIISFNDENRLIPIKPICDAIGIDYPTQYQKIKDDELLSSMFGLSPTVGADGKQREMACLPLEFIFGWIFSINPKNVKEEAKESISKYRIECYRALFNHFFVQTKKQLEVNEIEIKLLETLSDLNNKKSNLSTEISSVKKRLDKLRQERLENNPSLF